MKYNNRTWLLEKILGEGGHEAINKYFSEEAAAEERRRREGERKRKEEDAEAAEAAKEAAEKATPTSSEHMAPEAVGVISQVADLLGL